MNNFVYHAPTEVLFGRAVEQAIGQKLLALGAQKVLVHFGGGSVQKSGLLDKVLASLAGAALPYCIKGGVAPNPKVSLIQETIAFCRAEEVNFILAVGGGSVIDSAKAVAVGLATGRDPWEFVEKAEVPQTATLVGVVLTLAAAGSEMSDSCVMTNEAFALKRGIHSQAIRPRVAFLNPENTFTVSRFQTGCGIVDTMMHTLERYFTGEGDADLTERLAEAILVAVRDAGRVAVQKPDDYEARATLMWASSLSHNDLTGCGKNKKFPVHKMEHDISGLHDRVAHGAGLSVLFPAWAQYVYPYDVMKFAQLACRVWGVQMDFDHPERTARNGILEMKRYFREIGMPTTMAELGLTPADYEAIIAKTTVGGNQVKSYIDLGPAELLEIYQLAE